MKRKRKAGKKPDLHVDESCLQDGTLGVGSRSEFPICHFSLRLSLSPPPLPHSFTVPPPPPSLPSSFSTITLADCNL